jgi:hypothetical protein
MVSGRLCESESSETDTLNLIGLEALLDRAHMEVVGHISVPDHFQERSPEVRELHSLLDQLKIVYEMVRKTNDGLIKANARIANLVSLEKEQARQLDIFRERALQTEAVEAKLKEVQAENNLLKQTWWYRASQLFTKKHSRRT